MMSRRRLYSTRLFYGCAVASFAMAAISNARADLTTASTAPSYNTASIVHAATQTVEALAPNTIATVYGTNLSWTTHGVTTGDLNGGTLPTSLEGVTVYVNGILSSLFFVSPGQINFLIPYEIVAPSATVYVARQGVAGPPATIRLATTAPGFFQWNGNFALATHADGTLISSSAPAKPSEIIILYAAGLGRTAPDVPSGHVVSTATSILYLSQLQVLLNGAPCPSSSIYYAGLAPGFAGLYQINLRLPDVLPPNPAIQMVIGSQSSPLSIQLSTQ
jgi:uncharacterized protein (TIGR03437 family)